jgi:hypothetical protein
MTDDLTALIREGKLTRDDAKAIRKNRKIQEVRDAKREARETQQAAEHAKWLERQAEEKQMADKWADFVLAHQPALGDEVLQGSLQLREAVQIIEAGSGCVVGCEHRPLTAEQREQLWISLLQHLQREEATT